MKKNKFPAILALIVLSCLQPPLPAAERLANVFGDNMVLQRDRAVPIWGWAEKGQAIKVGFGGQEKTATADENGRWMVRLDPMPVNKNPQDLKVTGATALTVKNVLVGEVWICSGQSNMEWAFHATLNADAEKGAAAYPTLRTVKIRADHRPFPQEDTAYPSPWVVCSPDTVFGFTAVGYCFGRELLKELDVPVGLINTSWGGTLIEPWTCPEGFRSVPELKNLAQQVDAWLPTTDVGQKRYQDYIAQLKAWIPSAEAALTAKRMLPQFPAEPWVMGDHQRPTKIYNAMVHPLVPYAIRGAIWYQGESNGGEGETYYQKMKALIGGWRQLWGQGDFPFYYVQLANYQKSDTNNPAGGDGWAKLREAQMKTLIFPNTGMAVIIDIGDANDIHPRNKLDVGKRLARWALAKDYQKTIPYSGPLYKSCQVEGDKIRVAFDCAASGLMAGEKSGLDPVKEAAGGKVKWISIAGEDKKFFWADAVIDGQTLLVSSKDVPKPVAVRYAFTMNPEGAGLYNKDGLPASPFRTDAW